MLPPVPARAGISSAGRERRRGGWGGSSRGVAASGGREGRFRPGVPRPDQSRTPCFRQTGAEGLLLFLSASGVTTGRSVLPKRGEKARGVSCLPGSAGNVRRYEDAVFQKHRGRERRAPFQQKRGRAKASSREPAFFLISEGRRGTTCLPCLLPELCRTRFAVRFGAFPWWAKRGSRAPRFAQGPGVPLGRRRARKSAEGTEGVTPCSALCRGSLPGLRKSVFLPCAEHRRSYRERCRNGGRKHGISPYPAPSFRAGGRKFPAFAEKLKKRKKKRLTAGGKTPKHIPATTSCSVPR